MKEVIVITVFSAILAVASAHSQLFQPDANTSVQHAGTLASGADMTEHGGGPRSTR